MSDRELLELAAKAAGYVYLTGPTGVPTGEAYIPSDGNIPWNPLTDDGDALRLAVKLGLGLIYSENEQLSNVFKCGRHDSVIDLCEHFSDHCNDPYAATRRAIVRAAAEIGKEIK